MSEQDHGAVSRGELLEMAAEITTAFVSGNKIPAADLPGVISTIHQTLETISNGESEPDTPELRPAVPIKRSVTPNYIICLEDGRKLKMLKRHLKTAYDMTPEEYRAKWGLPDTYPMVAPDYAAKRSDYAKQFGLGLKGRAAKRVKQKD